MIVPDAAVLSVQNTIRKSDRVLVGEWVKCDLGTCLHLKIVFNDAV